MRMKTVFGGKPEELAEIHVVWSLLKSKATAVVEVHGKLCRETLGGDNVQYNQYKFYCKEKWTQSLINNLFFENFHCPKCQESLARVPKTLVLQKRRIG